MMDSHECCPSSFLFLSCTKFFDFGARQYSPALNRWLTIDPLSEQFYGISPYAFCNNNPVKRFLETKVDTNIKLAQKIKLRLDEKS